MKERLDILLVRGGFFSSREKAKTTIMAGQVYVNGQKEDKAGMKFDTDAQIEVRGRSLRYVSRGGLKLEKAVNAFGIRLDGRICMDVGASTGGFTDCMLQNGAARVYSVDVGHGQLDWKLREDDRVVCMERFNARSLTAEDLPEQVSFCSIDVSFISLKLILGPVLEVLAPEGEIVCLIKPQFEAGRQKVGRKGVVRDRRVHEEVIREVIRHAEGLGLVWKGLTFSPVTGPEGNIEYLAYFVSGGRDAEKRGAADAEEGCMADAEEGCAADITGITEEAHRTLNGSAPKGGAVSVAQDGESS